MKEKREKREEKKKERKKKKRSVHGAIATDFAKFAIRGLPFRCSTLNVFPSNRSNV